MSFYEQRHTFQYSGIHTKKRILTFNHEFNTSGTGENLFQSISLDKNSYLMIHRFIVKFNYAQAAVPGAEFYTNPMNFSGKFTMVLNSNGVNLASFMIPVSQHFDIKFDSFYFDEDSIKVLNFESDNSSFESYKDGVVSIAATIEKINLYFYCELMDYPKEIYKVQGNKLIYTGK